MNTYIESVLYTSKTLSNGEHPLMLRLTKNRKRKYISLHLSLSPNYWDFAKNKPKRNCPNSEQILRLIEQKTKELQEQVIDFKTSGAIYEEAYYQTAAYAQLVNEHLEEVLGDIYDPKEHIEIEQIVILRIGRDEDEGFEHIEHKNEMAAFSVFENALNLYNDIKAFKKHQKEAA